MTKVFHTKSEEEWMRKKEKEYQEMNEKLRENCLKLNKTHSIKPMNLMVDNLHKVAFCRNAKVGTGTWLRDHS